ncbi:hypothetical protein BJ875DRAFT_508218 [Amylocarpus encephaloides]|uniref:Enoyl reductase (ER) domain-containing protein n=1 Tax=Amylocarpus encephaloides TaxID=45428 RepID=A0A9P8C1C0_9HELO|nr:hypothetical protein BJ875DRAFT_508218 [Amylocarpus encephaloides]
MCTQSVFRLTSRNGFNGLQAFNEPIPTIDKHEVLLRVRRVALNYRDVAIATSTYPLPVKNQVIPCSDMAGDITQVGDLVNGFAVGGRVVAPLNPKFLYGPFKDSSETFGGPIDGMLREYIALPPHILVKLPKSSHSFAQWAAMVCTSSTAWNAFYGNMPLKPGDTVLILGTGGVSLTALIFAKAAGATTIITSSSDKKLEYVKTTFGADYTINYKMHPNWAAEVNRITACQGADHIIEVAYGGIVSLTSFLTSVTQDKMPDLTMSTIIKACVVRGVMGGSKQQLEEAVKFMGSHDLQVPLDKSFGFNRDEIIAALEYVASGEHLGKVCINLDWDLLGAGDQL